MSQISLDWETAEVSKGKLRVSLDERPTEEWAAVFERTQRLLEHGNWSKVKLKKDQVTVEGVEAGDEERLRFFLESVVQEANAQDQDEQAASEADGSEEDGEADPDAELTERFRAFAKDSAEPSQEG